MVAGIKPGRWAVSGLNSQAPNLWRGLKLAYPLWEGSGATVYDVAGTHDGSFEGSLTWVATPYGFGLRFDGDNNDYLDLGSFNPPSEGSWFFLIKFTNLGAGATKNRFIGSDDAYEAAVGSLGKLSNEFFQAGDDKTKTVDVVITIDTWYAVLMTYNFSNNEGFSYIDGIEVASSTAVNDDPGIDVLNIGRTAGSANKDFFGDIALILHWDRALTAGEAIQLNRNPFGMFTTRRLLVVPTGDQAFTGVSNLNLSLDASTDAATITKGGRTHTATTEADMPIEFQAPPAVIAKGGLNMILATEIDLTLDTTTDAATITKENLSFTSPDDLDLPVLLDDPTIAQVGLNQSFTGPSTLNLSLDPFTDAATITKGGLNLTGPTTLNLPIDTTTDAATIAQALVLTSEDDLDLALTTTLPVNVVKGPISLTSPDDLDLPIQLPDASIVGVTPFTQFGTQIHEINPDLYPTGTTFYIVGMLHTSSGAIAANIRLYNDTDVIEVSGSEASTNEITPTFVRSNSFTLSSGARKYKIEVFGDSGAEFTLDAAAVRIVFP